MKSFGYLILALALFLAGCGSKKTPPPQAKATNAPSDSGNPLTAPVDYLGALNAAKKTATRVVDTTSLNKAIEFFNAQEDRFPNDLNELVAKHYIANIPLLPRSMKYLYDPKTGKVQVVQQ